MSVAFLHRLFETLPSGLRTVNALRSSQVDHPQPALADKWSILSLVRGYIRGADLQGDHAVAPRRVLVHARKRSRPVPAKVIIFNAKVLVFDTQFLVFWYTISRFEYKFIICTHEWVCEGRLDLKHAYQIQQF